MTTSFSRSIGATVVVISLLAFLSITSSTLSPRFTSHYSSQVLSFSRAHTSNFDDIVSRVANSTLGFEKVFAIGLPERTDKRDALALTSSLTGGGIKIDWVDGVKGETIPDKAVPFGVNRTVLWENNLGSWRGHMNAVRSIVENGYASALIMEDDMDWDVRLKSQLESFASGAQFIQNTEFKTSDNMNSTLTDSPYGSNWDLLWLGHCGEVFPEQLPEYKLQRTDIAKPQKYIIHPDLTLPPPQHITGFQNYTQNPYTRWVHVTGGPICTFAYALSQSGARKVLFDLSVDHLLGPSDNALADLCRYGSHIPEGPDDDGLAMRCISITPPLFFHHKAKGYIGGDSDIQKVGSGDWTTQEVREKGMTENIDWSARDNVRNMILGLQPVSQFAGM